MIPFAFAQQNTSGEQTNPIWEGIMGLLASFPLWIIAVILIVITYIIAHIVATKVGNYLTVQQEEYQTLDTHKGVITLSERLTFLGVMVLGILIALTVSNLMTELGWLLGSLGLAIGFALQGVFINFISGIMLLAQEKTKIGNYVELRGVQGIIREIGMRATVVQTLEGIEILVPNKRFFEEVVVIYTSNPLRRMNVTVGVGYTSNLDQAISLVMEELAKHPEIQQEQANGVLVKEFTETCIVLNIRFWVKSRSAWWVIESDVMRQTKATFERSGIDFTPLYTYKKID